MLVADLDPISGTSFFKHGENKKQVASKAPKDTSHQLKELSEPLLSK